MPVPVGGLSAGGAGPGLGTHTPSVRPVRAVTCGNPQGARKRPVAPKLCCATHNFARVGLVKTAPGPLLKALTDLWSHAQAKHPELPPVRIGIITSAPPVSHEAIRWEDDEGRDPLLAISRDTLRAGHTEALEYVLHEAAHLLCWRRGLVDTVTRGVYHNARYLSVAVEIGLEWPTGAKRTPGRGFFNPRLTTATKGEYQSNLRALADVLPLVLPHLDLPDPHRNKTPSRITLVCQCPEPRRFQISPTVAEQGPIVCGVCRADFADPAGP